MNPQQHSIPPALADVAQVDANAICATFTWSRRHLYEKIREGTFPPGIKYGTHCVRWPAATVRAWAAAQQQ